MDSRIPCSSKKLRALVLVIGGLVLLAGCEELSRTVDGILGKSSPVLSSTQGGPDPALVPVKKRAPGARPPAPQTPTGTKPTASKPAAKKPGVVALEGKKSQPGRLSPGTQEKEAEVGEKKMLFKVERDPFKTPTEILPSECPPSMPLCRFDRSQLKLVGVIQVEQGEFKGMVEDPDGRGYFVTPGMQIGGATVTQVTESGITLHVHATRQVVAIPLITEGKETAEF